MRQRGCAWWLAFFLVLAVGTTVAAAYFRFGRSIPTTQPAAPVPIREVVATPQQIEEYCSKCHAYPPADSFPRWAWKEEVEKAYKIAAQMQARRPRPDLKGPPPMEQVIRFYQDQAPRELPAAIVPRATSPLPLRLERLVYPAPRQAPVPAIANVNLVHLFDERRLDVLACDMRAGQVMALRSYLPNAEWQILGAVPHPGHAEVIDLDGDGIKDILVANLGSMDPADHGNGSVVWLRGQRGGGFTAIPLLQGVGRVADVQAADFRGNGKRDLVVAEFGWLDTGRVLYLENQTTDWSHPVFVPRVLDDRHGSIHVPVADLNGDGKPDFVALISQEHETVVAFLNEGSGRFRKETLYTAPHPAYGSSGIQLVDMNGDGRLDVLYSNGDTMDPPYLLKPYHGIQWLENQGRYPFVHHPIAPMYGVHRAVAADFRGVGRLDIVAVSYQPPDNFPQRAKRDLDAVIYLEQTAPGQFARHALETVTCDHTTCAAGDIFGTGRIDLATANFVFGEAADAITIWRNQGAPPVRGVAERGGDAP